MTTHPQPHAHLHGRLRVAIQAVWLILVGLLLATFAAGVPVRFSYLTSLVGDKGPALFADLLPAAEAGFTSRLGPKEADMLQTFGLSHRFYAGYILMFEVALVLVCAVTGLFIFWRRSDDWMTLWVSLLLVLLGTSSVSLVVPTLATIWSGWGLVSTFASGLGMVSNLHILFLSPDGRWVPRWTLSITAGFTGGMLALGVYAITVFERRGVLMSSALIFSALPVWLGLIGLGIFSQIYRYIRVSSPIERQQTKWVVVGLAAVVLGFVVNAFFLYVSSQQSGLPRLLSYLIRAPMVNLCMMLLPICLAFSILRYRLWDIDLIIRRTLIYSVLSGLLALTYFSSIVLLQNLFRAGDNQLITVLSTLAIAALFLPLRQRVQDFIDRRFYRKKYDAAKTLAAFAATARDETDLEKLAARLVQVVDETMQPESVGLWLKPTAALIRKPTTSGGSRQVFRESVQRPGNDEGERGKNDDDRW